jgi:cardiolipin synthase
MNYFIGDAIGEIVGPRDAGRHDAGRKLRRQLSCQPSARFSDGIDGILVDGGHEGLLGRDVLNTQGVPVRPAVKPLGMRDGVRTAGFAGAHRGHNAPMSLDGRTLRSAPHDANDEPDDEALTHESDRWQLRLETLLGTPATTGNEIRVLRNGIEIFPAMIDAIDAAEHTVDLVTFVYWQGDIARRFADTLAAAARRGCRVRVLLDAIGAREMSPELVDEMNAAGCDVSWFRPIEDSLPEIGDIDHRTHRKILVCDSSIGFAGGVGIADEWDGDARDETEWRDTHLAIRGPAVAGLVAGFIDNWADQHDDGFDPRAEPVVDPSPVGSITCSVIRGSAETGASELWRLMLALISCAEQRVRIATAYFNPDDRLCAALCEAVERGVDVSILVPGEFADKRFVQIAGESVYATLLEAGVDIRTFDISMMHAKVITVDRVVATVGSANMNQRSTQFDEETNVVIFDPEVVAVLDRHLDDDHAHSTLIDPADWAERGVFQRASERVADVVSGWL